MEQNQKLDIGVGTQEAVKLEAKPVTITEVRVEPHRFGDDEPTDVLIVMVKHPDKAEPFQMYNVAYQKGNSIKTVGFSMYYDSANKILKGTAIAELLRITGVQTPRQLVGKTIQTIMSQKGYLALKAY